MFYSPKLYIRDPWIAAPAAGIIFIQIFMWWNLIANIHPALGRVFLHYNIIFGVDLAGEWWKIFFLPAGGLLVFCINYFLSFMFYGTDKFLARLMSFWALFFHIFLLVGVVFLVRLNA